jgi:REP element-mobilizing transposase RayT
MSHTHAKLLFHVVFSTQGRLPLLTTHVRTELFAYIGALVKEKKGRPVIINGVDDHLHLLIGLPADVSVSEMMRFIKSNSSRWMKERFGRPFAWQKGFGAFTVSSSNVDAVTRYIREQEEHHSRFDFKSAYVSLLTKNGLEYDQEYLWK